MRRLRRSFGKGDAQAANSFIGSNKNSAKYTTEFSAL
jgi:hypothetical protein